MKKGRWLLLAAGAAGAIGVVTTLRRKVASMGTRERIVTWAESQEHESDPTPYWYSAIGRNVTDPDTDWCGAFVLTALHRVGLALDRQWAFGKGLTTTLPKLKITNVPKPGDIAYFTHNQHVAIVAESHDGLVRLVNGNSTGGRVVINERSHDDVTAFYSIEEYLPESERQS